MSAAFASLTCPTCDGMGRWFTVTSRGHNVCRKCNGSGVVLADRRAAIVAGLTDHIASAQRHVDFARANGGGNDLVGALDFLTRAELALDRFEAGA